MSISSKGMVDRNGTHKILPLHNLENDHLITECAEMLNGEWKRSFGLRERSLRQSNDKFPYHVAMVELVGAGHGLVGHARITKVLNRQKALYLSSVIIKENRRGQGLGKILMQLVEDHMKAKGYDTIYLRTDSVEFYVKCGYERCDPIQEVASEKIEEKMSKLSEVYGGKTADSPQTCKDQYHPVDPPQHLPPPPAPPPPPPPPVLPMSRTTCGSRKTLYNSIDDDVCGEFQCKFWMKKVLALD